VAAGRAKIASENKPSRSSALRIEGLMSEHLLRCESCSVRHRAICGALEHGEIERLNAIAHHKLLPPGHVILHDNAARMYSNHS